MIGDAMLDRAYGIYSAEMAKIATERTNNAKKFNKLSEEFKANIDKAEKVYSDVLKADPENANASEGMRKVWEYRGVGQKIKNTGLGVAMLREKAPWHQNKLLRGLATLNDTFRGLLPWYTGKGGLAADAALAVSYKAPWRIHEVNGQAMTDDIQNKGIEGRSVELGVTIKDVPFLLSLTNISLYGYEKTIAGEKGRLLFLPPSQWIQTPGTPDKKEKILSQIEVGAETNRFRAAIFVPYKDGKWDISRIQMKRTLDGIGWEDYEGFELDYVQVGTATAQSDDLKAWLDRVETSMAIAKKVLEVEPNNRWAKKQYEDTLGYLLKMGKDPMEYAPGKEAKDEFLTDQRGGKEVNNWLDLAKKHKDEIDTAKSEKDKAKAKDKYVECMKKASECYEKQGEINGISTTREVIETAAIVLEEASTVESLGSGPLFERIGLIKSLAFSAVTTIENHAVGQKLSKEFKAETPDKKKTQDRMVSSELGGLVQNDTLNKLFDNIKSPDALVSNAIARLKKNGLLSKQFDEFQLDELLLLCGMASLGAHEKGGAVGEEGVREEFRAIQCQKPNMNKYKLSPEDKEPQNDIERYQSLSPEDLRKELFKLRDEKTGEETDLSKAMITDEKGRRIYVTYLSQKDDKNNPFTVPTAHMIYDKSETIKTSAGDVKGIYTIYSYIPYRGTESVNNYSVLEQKFSADGKRLTVRVVHQGLINPNAPAGYWLFGLVKEAPSEMSTGWDSSLRSINADGSYSRTTKIRILKDDNNKVERTEEGLSMENGNRMLFKKVTIFSARGEKISDRIETGANKIGERTEEYEYALNHGYTYRITRKDTAHTTDAGTVIVMDPKGDVVAQYEKCDNITDAMEFAENKPGLIATKAELKEIYIRDGNNGRVWTIPGDFIALDQYKPWNPTAKMFKPEVKDKKFFRGTYDTDRKIHQIAGYTGSITYDEKNCAFNLNSTLLELYATDKSNSDIKYVIGMKPDSADGEYYAYRGTDYVKGEGAKEIKEFRALSKLRLNSKGEWQKVADELNSEKYNGTVESNIFDKNTLKLEEYAYDESTGDQYMIPTWEDGVYWATTKVTGKYGTDEYLPDRKYAGKLTYKDKNAKSEYAKNVVTADKTNRVELAVSTYNANNYPVTLTYKVPYIPSGKAVKMGIYTQESKANIESHKGINSVTYDGSKANGGKILKIEYADKVTAEYTHYGDGRLETETLTRDGDKTNADVYVYAASSESPIVVDKVMNKGLIKKFTLHGQKAIGKANGVTYAEFDVSVVGSDGTTGRLTYYKKTKDAAEKEAQDKKTKLEAAEQTKPEAERRAIPEQMAVIEGWLNSAGKPTEEIDTKSVRHKYTYQADNTPATEEIYKPADNTTSPVIRYEYSDQAKVQIDAQNKKGLMVKAEYLSEAEARNTDFHKAMVEREKLAIIDKSKEKLTREKAKYTDKELQDATKEAIDSLAHVPYIKSIEYDPKVESTKPGNQGVGRVRKITWSNGKVETYDYVQGKSESDYTKTVTLSPNEDENGIFIYEKGPQGGELLRKKSEPKEKIEKRIEKMNEELDKDLNKLDKLGLLDIQVLIEFAAIGNTNLPAGPSMKDYIKEIKGMINSGDGNYEKGFNDAVQRVQDSINKIKSGQGIINFAGSNQELLIKMEELLNAIREQRTKLFMNNGQIEYYPGTEQKSVIKTTGGTPFMEFYQDGRLKSDYDKFEYHYAGDTTRLREKVRGNEVYSFDTTGKFLTRPDSDLQIGLLTGTKKDGVETALFYEITDSKPLFRVAFEGSDRTIGRLASMKYLDDGKTVSETSVNVFEVKKFTPKDITGNVINILNGQSFAKIFYKGYFHYVAYEDKDYVPGNLRGKMFVASMLDPDVPVAELSANAFKIVPAENLDKKVIGYDVQAKDLTEFEKIRDENVIVYLRTNNDKTLQYSTFGKSAPKKKLVGRTFVAKWDDKTQKASLAVREVTGVSVDLGAISRTQEEILSGIATMGNGDQIIRYYKDADGAKAGDVLVLRNGEEDAYKKVKGVTVDGDGQVKDAQGNVLKDDAAINKAMNVEKYFAKLNNEFYFENGPACNPADGEAGEVYVSKAKTLPPYKQLVNELLTKAEPDDLVFLTSIVAYLFEDPTTGKCYKEIGPAGVAQDLKEGYVLVATKKGEKPAKVVTGLTIQNGKLETTKDNAQDTKLEGKIVAEYLYDAKGRLRAVKDYISGRYKAFTYVGDTVRVESAIDRKMDDKGTLVSGTYKKYGYDTATPILTFNSTGMQIGRIVKVVSIEPVRSGQQEIEKVMQEFAYVDELGLDKKLSGNYMTFAYSPSAGITTVVHMRNKAVDKDIPVRFFAGQCRNAADMSGKKEMPEFYLSPEAEKKAILSGAKMMHSEAVYNAFWNRGLLGTLGSLTAGKDYKSLNEYIFGLFRERMRDDYVTNGLSMAYVNGMKPRVSVSAYFSDAIWSESFQLEKDLKANKIDPETSELWQKILWDRMQVWRELHDKEYREKRKDIDVWRGEARELEQAMATRAVANGLKYLETKLLGDAEGHTHIPLSKFTSDEKVMSGGEGYTVNVTDRNFAKMFQVHEYQNDKSPLDMTERSFSFLIRVPDGKSAKCTLKVIAVDEAGNQKVRTLKIDTMKFRTNDYYAVFVPNSQAIEYETFPVTEGGVFDAKRTKEVLIALESDYVMEMTVSKIAIEQQFKPEVKGMVASAQALKDLPVALGKPIANWKMSSGKRPFLKPNDIERVVYYYVGDKGINGSSNYSGTKVTVTNVPVIDQNNVQGAIVGSFMDAKGQNHDNFFGERDKTGAITFRGVLPAKSPQDVDLTDIKYFEIRYQKKAEIPKAGFREVGTSIWLLTALMAIMFAVLQGFQMIKFKFFKQRGAKKPVGSYEFVPGDLDVGNLRIALGDNTATEESLLQRFNAILRTRDFHRTINNVDQLIPFLSYDAQTLLAGAQKSDKTLIGKG
ncbi:MAG: hypothetical protein HQL28_02970 [Candidatus Omnitrophica bacterium]|nr:hypothetical protein [Candidatus Omnitrophota bacterium]